MAGTSSCQRLVFSTETVALKSYEKHLKKEGDVAVELLSFSEQSDLDADKLKRKLDETSQTSEVTVLLLLTGASSYLWFNTEHHPRNVELCNLLKQRFPDTLKFKICPTSKTSHDAWEAHKPQLESIFGPFFSGNNVSIWAGFDRDVDSTSPICSLIRKESAEARTDVVRRCGENNKIPIWILCIIAMLLLLAVVYFTKSYFALETKMAELQERFDKSQKETTELRNQLKKMQAQEECEKHLQSALRTLQSALRTAKKEPLNILAEKRVDDRTYQRDGRPLAASDSFSFTPWAREYDW